MDSLKVTLVIRHEHRQIPKRLSLNQSIEEVITIAKSLFGCSDEEQCSLMFNGKIFNEKSLLSDLNLENLSIIDLVRKDTLSDNLAFQILSGSVLINWQSPPSKRIDEVLQDFCSSNGLNSLLFQPFLDGRSLDGNTMLGEIPKIQDAVLHLVSKTGNSLVQTEEEEKLIDAPKVVNSNEVQNRPLNQRKVNEKKLLTLKYQDKSIKKQFKVDEKIGAIQEAMIKSLKLPAETSLIFKCKGEIMDFDKCLSDYFAEIIIVEIAKDQQVYLKILVLYNEKELELIVESDFLIKRIRDMACQELNLKPFYLYSLTLDDEFLQPSTQLQDISAFSDDSVFELFSKIEIALADEASNTLGSLILDPNLNVEELKKQILLEKNIDFKEMNLRLADIQLEDNTPLRAYIKNEDPVVLTIQEKRKNQIEINTIFTKIPENKKLAISIPRNKRFQDLVETLGREFDVDKLTQVWKHKDQNILIQSDWEEFITKFDREDDLLFEVFECIRPVNQQVCIKIYCSKNSESQHLKLNLLKLVASLKQEVAKELNFHEKYSQRWEINSQELLDEIPLAAQYNPTARQDLHIYLQYQRQVTLFVEDKSQSLLLDFETSISTLKETLFKETKIEIYPRKQLWFLGKENSQIIQDNQALSSCFEGHNKYEIWIQEKETQAQEKEIKEWIEKEMEENFKRKLVVILNDFKNNNKVKLNWEKDFSEKLLEERKIIKENFRSEFQEQTDRQLFESLEKTLDTHIDEIKIEFENELNIQSHQKQEKASEILLQTVIENYTTNPHQIDGCLPSLQFPQKDNTLFKDYQQILENSLIQIYTTEKRFEYTKQHPALILKGGKSNILYKYFDLRQYFEKQQFHESMGILKSEIISIFDIAKIKHHSSRSPNYKDQEKLVIASLIKDVTSELMQCGLWVSEPLLESSLKYHQKWFYLQLYSEPVQDEDITQENFRIFTVYQAPTGLKYVDYEKIKAKKREFESQRRTSKSLIFHVLKHCIKKDRIKELSQSQVEKIFLKIQHKSLIAAIQADLAIINLEFQGLEEYLPFICYEDEREVQKLIIDNVISSQKSLEQNPVPDIANANFSYLKKDTIQQLLQKVESNSKDAFIILKLSGERWVTKGDSGNVSWLISYAKEDLGAIFQNTLENKSLAAFVTKEFGIKNLFKDIFETCVSKLESMDDWNFIQLYEQIVRETNNLISAANEDLQQVSYRLDFKLVGEIHLKVVHFIWKYFEERDWKKVSQDS